MGATGVAGRGITGTEGTGAVGMAETGTESAAGAGATGEAGAVIPSPAAISGPLEVSASGEMSMQTKRKYKKWGMKRKGDTYPSSQVQTKHYPLHQSQKQSSSTQVHHQDPQKCQQTLLKISPGQGHGWQNQGWKKE